MPRNLLINRRAVRDSPSSGESSQVGMNTSMNLSLQNHVRHLVNDPAQESDEELPSPTSDDSCDSGRDSTVPSDLSHSTSFDNGRPLQLGTGSSTSSDSFYGINSPLSPFPHPMGHIALLPGILESLAVSGRQQQSGVVTLAQARQLAQPPSYAETAASGSGRYLLNSGSPSAQLLVELQSSLGTPSDNAPSPFLSPASRKRSNSITNVGECNSSGATAATYVRQASKHQKVKTKQKGHEATTMTSPVSGTFIREPNETSENHGDVIVIRRGDLDKSLNVVEVTEEARAGLAEIVNKLGPYTCRLCKVTYQDAFGLAGHNCPRIIHIEYQCPECGKSFHCPANLASHRRWHKPRPAPVKAISLSVPVVRRKADLTIAKSENLPKPVILRAEEVLFVQKSETTNMPFKKRFFLRKSEENDRQRRVEEQKIDPFRQVQRSSLPSENLMLELNSSPASTGRVLLHEFQQHHCQICGAVIRGTQLFAHHWQQCLIANR